MNLKSIFWGLTLFLTSCSLLHAQTITGRVVEADGGEPLPFVNIAILQLPDSTLVTGTISDNDGMYTLNLPETSASLLLNVSSIGYRSLTLPVHGSDLSVLRLQADAALLNEVVVTGKRVVTHRFENNGISTDINVSPLRTLGTALDVLGQLPFIYKDGDAISVLGRGTPLIYINNRLVRDMNEVKQLRSEQIKKVLVITNPGAEYDGTVSAVIRITTVKGQGEGWSGTSSATGIVDRKYSLSAQQDLNYRTGEWDFFGMGFIYSGKDLEYMDFEQETPKRETADTKILSRFSVRQYVPIQNVYARGGFNKSFGDEGNFGARYTFSRTIPQMAGLYFDGAVFEKTGNTETLINEFTSDWVAGNGISSHSVNAYFTGRLASWLSLKVDADYAHGVTTMHQDATTETAADDNTQQVITNQLQDYDLYAAKATFTSPLWGSAITYGGEYSHTYNANSFEVPQQGGTILTSAGNSSKQNLAAGFVSFSKPFGRFNVDLGLRYEYTGFDYFDENGTKTDESKTYGRFFPSAGITYSGDQVQLMFAYRNTIYRPSYYQLRQGLQYDTPYLYEGGNPLLKPSYTNSISLQGMWKKLMLSATYKMYNDKIIWDISPDSNNEEILIMRSQNLSSAQSLNITANYTLNLGFYTVMPTVSFSKDFISYNGMTFNEPYWQLMLQNSFQLPWGMQAGINLMCVTTGNTDMQEIASPLYRTNVRLSKTFLDNKLRVNLSGSDIFNQNNRHIIQKQMNGQVQQWIDTNGTNVQMTITYNFNATRSKYKGERSTNEFNRL